MNKNSRFGMAKIVKLGVFLTAAFAFGQTAYAADGTAANHIIQNTANVRFQDSGGTTFNDALNDAAYQSSVSITVNTVQIAPSTSFVSSDTDVDNVLQGATVTFTYELASLSNGPEVYALTPSSADTNMDGAPTFAGGTGATFSGGVYTIAAEDMGASSAGSAIAGASVPTTAATETLTVPADDANDGSVNGLTAGDSVRITTNTGFWTCDVNAVDDSNGGTANATSTIDINNCVDGGTGGDITIGDQIGEVHQLTVVITTNNVTTGLEGTHAISVSVDTAGAGGATGTPTDLAANGDTTLTVKVVDLDIFKFVRNADTNVTGTTGSPFDVLTVGGATFYRAGVNALPGEVLEYAVVLINRGAPTSDVEVVDPFVLFTTYIAATDAGAPAGLGDGTGIRLIRDATVTSLDCDTGGDTCQVTAGTIEDAADDGLTTAFDFGGTDGSNLFIFAGTGGDENSSLGGTMSTGQVSVAIYSVRVD